ncbi:MAG TPA: CVNH domain-containing protein [Methylocystis sp.]|nr:CVNH domain-containing protein [Methylocystis sp.]
MKAASGVLTSVMGVAAFVLLAAGASAARAQPASTFQNSCTDTHIRGALLMARCRRMDGGWRGTSIEIPGVENIDGQLRFTGIPRSNFQLSCEHIQAFGSTLSAVCRRRDGSWGESSIQIPMIENINGELRYRR